MTFSYCDASGNTIDIGKFFVYLFYFSDCKNGE